MFLPNGQTRQMFSWSQHVENDFDTAFYDQHLNVNTFFGGVGDESYERNTYFDLHGRMVFSEMCEHV